LLGCGVLWFVLLLLAGCDATQSPAPSSDSDLQSDIQFVRVGMPNQPSSALMIVALETRALAQEGIEPILTEYPSGKRALVEGLLAGREDLITAADVPIALAGFTDAPLRIIASIFSTDDVNRIATRRSLGITRSEDLAGRRIGTQQGSAVHFFWHLFSLDRQMHAPEQLRFFKAEELPAALADGRIDAFSMREPFVSEARALIGDDLLVFAAPGLYGQHELLVASESMARERPETLRRVVRALLFAEAYCRLEPQAAQALVAEHLGVPVAKIAALWPELELRVRLDQGLLLLLEDEARWALGAGLVPAAPLPNYLDLIDLRPLVAEQPRVVTLFR
jgi:ABC-type nitrate/sulfonate/bicarbonate transport system substrate-binding protein